VPVETAEAPTAIETTTVDPAIPVEQTETPAIVAEPAAESTETAATPQIEVVEEKPDYMTRADWEREKAEVEKRAAADALEADRRRRQTQNAREAAQKKRDDEERTETIDVARATLASQLGVNPELITDTMIDTAITRVARKRAEGLTAGTLDQAEQAWDFLVKPAYRTTPVSEEQAKAESDAAFAELDDTARAAASRLGPKLQHLVNTIRPAIEAEARKGYIAESELPARVQAEIARINAKANEGKEELKRVEGAPSPTDASTISERLDRIGTAKETPADRAWWDAREKARGR